MGRRDKKIDDVSINQQPISISKRGDKAKGCCKNSRWQHMTGKKTLTNSLMTKITKTQRKFKFVSMQAKE